MANPQVHLRLTAREIERLDHIASRRGFKNIQAVILHALHRMVGELEK